MPSYYESKWLPLKNLDIALVLTDMVGKKAMQQTLSTALTWVEDR
jgi:hypothetical protein